MRNIWFRGKTIEDSEWVYGNYLIDSYGNIEIRTVPTMGDYKIETYSVYDDESLGQFTGMFDCVEREIYENDRVIISNEIECIVKFVKGAFCLIEIDSGKFLDYLFSYENETDKLKVIENG